MEHVIHLFEMVFAMIIFCGMMATLISASNTANSVVYEIAYKENDNTTIFQNEEGGLLFDNYMPVTKNGQSYYEGELSGALLVTEIKELDDDVIVYIEANCLNNLLVNGKPFLTYVREYNDLPLKDAILLNRTYLRTYTYNADGSIASIKYVFKPI